MSETKFGKVHKEYRDINKGIVEWIIGLTIAELGLIISQSLYSFNWIFFSFVGISCLSILLAVIIMHAIISSVDSELYAAFLAVRTQGKMEKEQFEKEYEERLGKFTKLIINAIFDKKAYRFLFVSFALNTAAMIALIFLNIQN